MKVLIIPRAITLCVKKLVVASYAGEFFKIIVFSEIKIFERLVFEKTKKSKIRVK